MFFKQTHPDKRLIVLDDSGDKQAIDGGGVFRMIYRKLRYPTLGYKRNCCEQLAIDIFPETDAVAVWDSDDLYLPHHLSAMNAALEVADWSLPSEVLYRQDCCGKYRRHMTGPGTFYHAGMGFRLDAFHKAGGYPDDLSGPEDQGLFRRLEATGASICDPIALTGLPPSYVYGTNDGLMHISAYLKPGDTGADAYAMLGQQPCEAAELVIEPPPGVELDHPDILPGLFPRPF